MNRDNRRIRAAAGGKAREWYKIRNAAADDDGPAEILIYDEIGYSFWGGVSAQDFARDLTAIDNDEITVRLNSPGGDVFDGIAILNALRAHKARITVYVDGLAASAASFIAMAGDEVVMRRNSELMIHDAWGFCSGNAADMQTMADDLDRISNNIASIYADRTSGTVDEWREVMRQETWYSDAEAVAAGLADRVDGAATESADAKASFDLSFFNYAGRRHAPAPAVARNTTRYSSAAEAEADKKEGPMATLQEALAERLGTAVDADDDTLLAALDEALDEQTESTPAENSAEPSADAVAAYAARRGLSLVDSSRLEDVENAAAEGREARRQQLRAADEAFVDSAIRAGKFGPGRRDHWLDALAKDREGARADIESLASGLIPVGEPIGHAQDAADVDMSNDELDAYAAQFGISKGALNA